MKVPDGLYISSALFQRSQALWKKLAAIETALLREELQAITITSPIYIAGVARSGSTVLLEMLSRHPQLTCHRYSDFPNIYTPYWRNWLKQRLGGRRQQAQERAHRDRIQITEDSPEAIEEALWMMFFPTCHDSGSQHVLDAHTSNPAFASFYCDHIRKLLMVRKRRRYLSKGNYNLTRLAYIQSLFPDARFIIPVRHPVQHIASLIKQDNLFTEGLRNNTRARRYLIWAGHFEFGPDKSPVNSGDAGLIQEIIRSWQQNRQVRGWALYWNALYRLVLNQLAADKKLQSACIWVRYEDLCHHSAETIDRILAHCRLPSDEFARVRSYYIDHLSEPDYYRPTFNQAELQSISELCGETASRLGYE